MFQKANQATSSRCTKALETPLPPPPFYGSQLFRRMIDSETQNRTQPGSRDGEDIRRMNAFVVIGAYLIIFVWSTTIALLSIIFVIKGTTLFDVIAFILFSPRRSSGVVREARPSHLTGAQDMLPYLEEIDLSHGRSYPEEISSSLAPRSNSASGLRRRYIGTEEKSKAVTIHDAANVGDLKTAKALAKSGDDLSEIDEFGKTGLQRAAENGHDGVVRVLLDEGVDPDSKDSNQQTPLLWAAMSGHTKALKLLLEKGADREFKDDEYGRTPLFWAMKNRHERVLNLLLQAGADIEAKEATGGTPLHQSAWGGT
ncbi:MAG: hypothetical protein Q9226_003092 [Calogaya cf. arnoldii]